MNLTRRNAQTQIFPVAAAITAAITAGAVIPLLGYCDSSRVAMTVLGGGAVVVIIVLILLRPQWGLWMMLATLPLERIPSVEIANITFRPNNIIVPATLLAWIMWRRRSMPKNPLLLPLLLYALAAAISTIHAEYPQRLLLVAAFLAVTASGYFNVVHLARDRSHIQKAVKIILVTSIVICVFGMYQFAGDLAGLPQWMTGARDAYSRHVVGITRMHATCLEPLHLLSYLIVPLCLALSLWMHRTSVIGQRWQIAVLAAGSICVVLAAARSGIVALVAALVFFMLYLRRMPRQSRRNIAVVLTAVLAVTVGIWLAAKHAENRPDQPPLQRLLAIVSNYNPQQPSALSRLRGIKYAIQLYRTHPYTGVGLGNFGPHFQHLPQSHWIEDQGGLPVCANLYIEPLTEIGPLGLLALLLAIAMVFYRTHQALKATDDRLLRATLIGLSAALFGRCVQYMFRTTLYDFGFWILLGLIVATQNAALNNRKDTAAATVDNHRLLQP